MQRFDTLNILSIARIISLDCGYTIGECPAPWLNLNGRSPLLMMTMQPFLLVSTASAHAFPLHPACARVGSNIAAAVIAIVRTNFISRSPYVYRLWNRTSPITLVLQFSLIDKDIATPDTDGLSLYQLDHACGGADKLWTRVPSLILVLQKPVPRDLILTSTWWRMSSVSNVIPLTIGSLVFSRDWASVVGSKNRIRVRSSRCIFIRKILPCCLCWD